jgi:hypothetical protein
MMDEKFTPDVPEEGDNDGKLSPINNVHQNWSSSTLQATVS